MVEVIRRAVAPGVAAFQVFEGLFGALAVVDLAAEFGDVALGFLAAVGAVELGDFFQEVEAFGIVVDDPLGGHEEKVRGFPKGAGGLLVEVAPGEVLVAGGVVGLAIGFGIEGGVGEEFSDVVAVGGDPEAKAVAGAEDGEVAFDSVPGGGVEFEVVDEVSAGAVGGAGADDGCVELLVVVGAEEDLFAGEFVFAVVADGLLGEGFVDQDGRGDFGAVGADGGAEDEVVAALGEGAEVGFGLIGVEADHVDDDVEVLTCGGFEGGEVAAIGGDLGDFGGKRILALRAVEDGYICFSGKEMLHDTGGDETRAAEDEYFHGSAYNDVFAII